MNLELLPVNTIRNLLNIPFPRRMLRLRHVKNKAPTVEGIWVTLLLNQASFLNEIRNPV